MSTLSTEHKEALQVWCRGRVKFKGRPQYKDTVAAAERNQKRAPSGVLIHTPRKNGKGPNRIIYALWYGESLDKIEETFAWLLLKYPERTDRRVINCVDGVGREYLQIR